MSDLVNPKARMAEFWIGPHEFHTIPCMNPKRENNVNTSHLLPYTLLYPGRLFVSGLDGERRGSLSAWSLDAVPIVLYSRINDRVGIDNTMGNTSLFTFYVAPPRNNNNRCRFTIDVTRARNCACLSGSRMQCENCAPVIAILDRSLRRLERFFSASPEPQWRPFHRPQHLKKAQQTFT